MKILGYNYKLDLDKTLKSLDGNMGFCNMDHQVLTVASDLEDDAKCSTLLHEAIEALNYHLELKLEHRQISSLEAGLHQVLSDNGVDLSPLLEDNKKKRV